MIEKHTSQTRDIIKTNYLKDVWTFEDLHREHEAPAFVYRMRKCVVRHINTIGENFMIANSANDNVDIYDLVNP
jgi:hypothetical protein